MGEDNLGGDPAGLRGLVHDQARRWGIVHAQRQTARAFGSRHGLAIVRLGILHGWKRTRHQARQRVRAHLKSVRALQLRTPRNAF